MKLKLFLLATSAVALASCSSDAVVEDNAAGNAIQFSATANQASRAADYYCNNALPADFHVWASVNKKQYFADEVYAQGTTELTKTTYSIKNGVERYWPNEEISFWALKNHQNQVWNVNGMTTKFTVAGAAADQNDLIYAYTKATRAHVTDGKAPINFRHALSQIVFQAKNDNPKIRVKIDKVEVVNVAGTGVFTLPDGDNVTNANVNYHGQAEASAAKTGLGSWVNEAANKTFTTGDFGLTLIKNTVTNLTNNRFGIAEHETANPTHSLLLLPQEIAALDLKNKSKGDVLTALNGGAHFLVYCTIQNVAGGNEDDDVYLWADKTTENVIKTKAIAIPVNQTAAVYTWKQGKKYIYTFNFTNNGHGGFDPGTGEDVLIPISFTVTVDDFTEVDAGNIDIDK